MIYKISCDDQPINCDSDHEKNALHGYTSKKIFFHTTYRAELNKMEKRYFCTALKFFDHSATENWTYKHFTLHYKHKKLPGIKKLLCLFYEEVLLRNLENNKITSVAATAVATRCNHHNYCFKKKNNNTY